MLGCEHHGLDGGDLGGRELTRVSAGAGRTVVQGTGCTSVAPRMIAGRFEAEDPEDEGKREDGLRALDGSEDIRRHKSRMLCLMSCVLGFESDLKHEVQMVQGLADGG
jgi:hypothetical protein